jgi:hypothetical protein
METSKVDLPPDKIALVLHCGGYFSHRQIRCQGSVEFKFSEIVDFGKLTAALRLAGFYPSAVTPPGTSPVAFDILCGSCLRKIYPPEMVRAILGDS